MKILIDLSTIIQIAVILLISISHTHAQQGVAISTNGSSPDPSAMLHVIANDKGVLIPNLILNDVTTEAPVSSPATGLLIYNDGGLAPDGFYYWDGANWQPLLAGKLAILSDADSDTKIEVDDGSDPDEIAFTIAGQEVMRIDSATLHLEAPGNSLFIGQGAGVNDDGSSNENVFIGSLAGSDNTSGYRNTFVGRRAGTNNTSGNSNSFIGHQAAYFNTAGSHNVFLGNQSGFSNKTGSYNILIGKNAGYKNDDGNRNIFIGNDAGRSNVSHHNIIAIGDSTLHFNTSNHNLAIGTKAGLNNTTASGNTFIGAYSGYYNELDYADRNTFVGYQSGYQNNGLAQAFLRFGSENVFMGYQSGYHNKGHHNTFIGYQSGYENILGISNTFLGHGSGISNIEGVESTYLGTESGRTSTGNGNIFVGYRAGYKEVGSNKLYIHNDSMSFPLIYGEFDNSILGLNGQVGIQTKTPTTDLHVKGIEGVLFEGTQNQGQTLALGTGNRMHWYPKKGAFRAGKANMDGWDDPNIGDYSTAFGSSTIASGNVSTALGGATMASGDWSTAMGIESKATGLYSTSSGYFTEASGTASLSSGFETKALGNSSTSIGFKTTSETYSGLAIGRYNIGGGNKTNWIGDDPLFEIGIGTSATDSANAMTVLKNGNIGIITHDPIASLHVTGNEGLLFQGTFGSGEIMNLGAGDRVHWYPRKSAFRAGYVTSSQWDDVNIGVNSVAFGINTIAKGHVSTAIGESTSADASHSFAIGLYNVGGGNSEVWLPDDPVFEVGVGSSSSFKHNALTVLKNGKVGIITHQPKTTLHVTGINGVLFEGTFGNGDVINLGAGTRMHWYPKKAAFRAGLAHSTFWDDANIGEYSVAFGYQTQATGSSSVALGRTSSATGNNSIAAGISSIASGFASSALGDNTNAIGNSSCAIGHNTNADAYASFVIGRYNVGGGETGYWDDPDPVFEIGTGTFSMPSNAMTVVKNGNVGVGTPTPKHLLQVHRVGHNASYLSFTNSDTDSMSNDGFLVGIDHNEDFRIHAYEANKDILFWNGGAWRMAIKSAGNIGIGTITPGYKLHVVGEAYSTVGWSSSDLRWKKNMKPLKSSLDRIIKLKGVNYDWRTEEFPEMNFSNTQQVGLIAQDVEPVIPEIVSTDEKGYKAISYEKLTPYLVEAIKEQQQIINNLKQENQTLKESMDHILDRLDKLENMK